MSNGTDVPTETHPAYAGLRLPLGEHDAVWHVCLPVLRSLHATFAATDEPLEVESLAPRTRVLTVRKCTGPAPFVGRPFAYFWKVATDELGRSVVGDAWIEHDPRYYQTPDGSFVYLG